ncbi:hypothetical protein [Falsiroseomonas sp. HW251]|uniref:hypothetical protein n=1 Tax=Falsiroseomonas sp. HW251 TaxID=3390998 RepID=UPI003D315FDF
MQSRLAAAMLAASLLVPPALAGEHSTYHYLEAPPEALQPCRAGMLLSMPPSWQSGDGAVVLLTMERPQDAARDALVSALLFEEHAAVVELMPVRCDASSEERDGVVAGAIDALDAVTRRMGSGMVVAIGYGPGARAILDVVDAGMTRPRGADAPRYAAAVAIGDGAPAFALGAPPPAREGAPMRLAALCRSLAAVAGGMGATVEREAPAAAAAACAAAMSAETLPATESVHSSVRR